jgi:transcriptional regulator EpsA
MQQSLMFTDAERDSLVSILDGSLRVRKRHQFFLWIQGAVQSLLPHDILITAVGDFSKNTFHFDCFSAIPVSQEDLKELCHSGHGVMQRLIRQWEVGTFRPLLLRPEINFLGTDANLQRVIDRFGLCNIGAHGTFNIGGTANCFFAFAKMTSSSSPERLAHTLELIVPFVASAFIRTHLDAKPIDTTAPFSSCLLTTRQTEILCWVQQGKSNAEIGDILSVSPLTIKNHVQKILRKLNVQNRTQAAAKGLSLNIVTQQIYG